MLTCLLCNRNRTHKKNIKIRTVTLEPWLEAPLCSECEGNRHLRPKAIAKAREARS